MSLLNYIKRLFTMVNRDPLKPSSNKLDLFESQTRKKLCAIVIGHKKSSQGASNPDDGTTEFMFNDDLAKEIEQKFENNQKIEIQRVYRRTYNSLPDDINELDPDFIISLHCNAFNTKASGSEVLYYHKSKKSEKLASILNKNINTALQSKNRGIKGKFAKDRGGYLLKYTNAPCVIVEPFFIDNTEDYDNACVFMSDLINAYVRSIREYSKEI